MWKCDLLQILRTPFQRTPMRSYFSGYCQSNFQTEYELAACTKHLKNKKSEAKCYLLIYVLYLLFYPHYFFIQNVKTKTYSVKQKYYHCMRSLYFNNSLSRRYFLYIDIMIQVVNEERVITKKRQWKLNQILDLSKSIFYCLKI